VKTNQGPFSTVPDRFHGTSHVDKNRNLKDGGEISVDKFETENLFAFNAVFERVSVASDVGWMSLP